MNNVKRPDSRPENSMTMALRSCRPMARYLARDRSCVPQVVGYELLVYTINNELGLNKRVNMAHTSSLSIELSTPKPFSKTLPVEDPRRLAEVLPRSVQNDYTNILLEQKKCSNLSVDYEGSTTWLHPRDIDSTETTVSPPRIPGESVFGVRQLKQPAEKGWPSLLTVGWMGPRADVIFKRVFQEKSSIS